MSAIPPKRPFTSAAVGLLYWLIRRSAVPGFASLFYLVPVVTASFAYILVDEAAGYNFHPWYGDLRRRRGSR
jgi:hypothetical protein